MAFSPAPGILNGEVNVGCFGAIRLMKNHVEQAIGAIKFAESIGKALRFHVNGTTSEINTNPILKSLYTLFQGLNSLHQLVLHDWLPHDEFVTLVQSMDVVSQVSFSETFNIVAADAAANNVALVASAQIPWATQCFQADPNDSDSIATIMARAYSMKQRFPSFNSNLRGLKQYNSQTQEQWLKFLSTVLV